MVKTKLKDSLIFLIFMIFAGILSISYGMERTFDFRNYHIYNPFAFLTDRLTTDIMPAGIQSYYNPLLDIPYYLAIKYLNNHPFFVTFLMGFSYALFLFLIYKITKLIFKEYKPWLMTIFSLIIISGSTYIIRYIGWLSHDLFVADLLLFAIYLLLKTFDKEYHPKLFLISGLLAGFALGAKYTIIIYYLPLLLCLLIFYKQFKKPVKSISLFCLGGLGGFLIADGFWMYKLWITFGNPIYPHFNWIFHSPDIAAGDVYNLDYMVRYPTTQLERWLAPFFSLKDEVRFKILWIVFALNTLLLPFIKKENFIKSFNINITQNDFIILFCFIAYIFWRNIFPVPRYYSPILAFLGIVIIILFLKIYYILKNFLYNFGFDTLENTNLLEKIYLIIIMLIFIVICFPNYKQPVEKKLVRASIDKQLLYVEDLYIPDNSIVLVKSGNAFAIPFQNPNARYFHMTEMEFARKNINILSDKKLNYMKDEIKRNKNKVYYITNTYPTNYTNINVEEIKQKLIKSIELKNNMSLEEKNHFFDISTQEAEVLEFNKLGIDTKNISCEPIKNNIKNDKYVSPMFFCKLNIK